LDGRYEIGHILSVGGFATVARARDLQRDGAPCAVKIFRYEFGDRAWIRHRFEQEISALEQLSHPNIVRITGHGAIDTGAPYLVMEFIQGRSLREQLDQGAIPRHQIGVFLRQVAGALHSLHRKAIYHRDLKPENLMIRSDADGRPEIVLIDFSIAIVKSPNQTFHGISRVAGTLEYMAPEQVIGYADASTDIYSLTKIVMEMLTGLRWAELFPEATLDLPDRINDYFSRNSDIFHADSIAQIVSAIAFDPAGRPKDVWAFATPIIRDLERLT
jgi:serine/threonine-protein kinase